MMKYKYKLLAEEILEDYVNAYSEVDLECVANKLEEIAKDTAKEICEMIDGTCISSKGYLCSIISKRYGVRCNDD